MHKGVWEVPGRLTRFLEFPLFPQCYLNIFDHMAVSIKKKKEQKMNISFSMFFTLHIVGLYKICTSIFYTLKHTYPQ